MELISDWHLQHRDEGHLTGLISDAGVDVKNIRCDKESEGVNLFMHVEKK
jgi:hypothetical protein